MPFESILNKNSKQGLIIGKGGSFNFDVITVESHISNLRVTENPVETGGNISDHAVLEPKEVTIEGLMVGYEVKPNISSSIFGNLFDDYPLPTYLGTDAAYLDHVRRMDEAANKARDAVSEVTDGVTRLAADFLPNYQTPLNDSSGGNKILNALDKLLDLQRSGEPVTVMTHTKQYEDMMIVSIVLNQDKKLSGEFTITFREIFIVESKVGSGLIVEGSNMPSQVSRSDLGVVEPKEYKGNNQSALSAGADAFREGE